MKRKILKILVLVLIIVSVFLIYRIFHNDKINYIEINMGIRKDYKINKNKIKYYKKYNLNKVTISLIKYNTTIKRQLRESNLVVINVKVKDEEKYLEELLKEVRKYAKEKVMIIAYYEKDLIFNYLNNKYKEIAIRYNCIYIENKL